MVMTFCFGELVFSVLLQGNTQQKYVEPEIASVSGAKIRVFIVAGRPIYAQSTPQNTHKISLTERVLDPFCAKIEGLYRGLMYV